MMYAPVLIPTLNRYKHLKECLESLAANEFARETEVYISVDYPPNEKYEEGYKKIRAYLNRGIKGFKEVHIFFQKENLGPSGNSLFLYYYINKKNDRYIVTEDDNIFSKNFLGYMNWALERFEFDENVVAVSGFSQDVAWKNKKIPVQMIGNEYNAWGTGLWVKKNEIMREYIIDGHMERELKRLSVLCKLLVKRTDLFYEVMRYLLGMKTPIVKDGRLVSIDITRNIYLILEKKYTLMPTVTKVNNLGFDGSGVHCLDMFYKQQKLDENIKWVVDESQLKLNGEENEKILRNFFLKQKISNKIKNIVKWRI